MTSPLAEAMYDHDDIQGQSLGRQEQDHINQIQDPDSCDCWVHKKWREATNTQLDKPQEDL